MLLFVLAATSVSGATNQSSTAATNQPAGTNAAAKPHADTNAEKPPKLIITPTPKALPNIIRGPYLQCGTTNSMVIRWRTDVPCPSVVRYGLSLTNLNKKTNSSGILSEHVVLISGLQPDTRYYYSLGTADCPIFARLTNNMLFVSTTNGAMAVSTAQRVELANVTNETLVLRVEKKQLLIARPKDGRVVNSSNTVLVVSTTNHSLVVNWTNRTLAATTTNHIRGTRPAGSRSSRSSFGTFVVLNTNVTMAGGDTNTFFFTSPPIGRRKPVRIWVLGDPGTRKAEQKIVRDAFFKYAGSRRPDLWLMLGDNAYQTGTDTEYQGSIFQAYEDVLKTRVLWPTLGNHDAGSASSSTQSGIYYDIFTLPTQGQAGGVMSGTEAYYSYDYANVHLICLDSASSDRTTNGLMYKWLKADLAANRQDWCIAYWHHPPYTKGSHDSDNEKEAEGIMRDMRIAMVPALEEGGVDLVLCGHSHAYERSFLLDLHYGRSTTLEDDENIRASQDGREDGWGVYHKPTAGPASHEGTVYMVAGSSGQISGGRLLHPAMYTGLNVLGSLALDFDGLRLDSQFIDTNVMVRDYFTIVKGPSEAASVHEPAHQNAPPAADLKIPEHLEPLLQITGSGPNRTAATNAQPSDQELLLKLYQEATDPSQKAALTWALAYIGNAEVVTSFLRLLTNQFSGQQMTLEQENICLETAEALGLLATRYEAAYEFLKKAIHPSFWQTNNFVASPRGYQSPGALAARSLRALGISGRPESLGVLLELRKRGVKYRLDEHPDYVRNFSNSVALGIAACESFRKMGPAAFHKQILQNEVSTRKFD